MRELVNGGSWLLVLLHFTPHIHTFHSHLSFIDGLYTKGTRAHTQKELIRGGLSERARVARHYGPLCSTRVAAKSGSICIAVTLPIIHTHHSHLRRNHSPSKCCENWSMAARGAAPIHTSYAHPQFTRIIHTSQYQPTMHTSGAGAATHPGVGGGTHRRRATFDRR